jgi:MSHA biogenesis protein MshI
LLLVESPDVLPAELKAAVRWRLKDLIDFPVDDAIVDVFGIPEQARRTGAKMMYAVAAKRQAIDAQVSFLKSVAPRFEVIDIPELALRNLVAQLPEASDGLILLWLNPDSAQLLVIKGATLYVTRRVQFADARHDATNLDADDVAAIALEVQRSMDYFESHYEQAPIGHLLIAPPGDSARNLAADLATQVPMRIQTLDLARALQVPPGLALSGRASLLAIGAALRDDAPTL